MGGVDAHVVVELQEEVVERTVQLLRQPAGLVLPEQVGPAHRVGEQAVAAEDGERRVGAVALGGEVRHVFGGVARRVLGGEDYPAQVDLVAVLQLLLREAVLRPALGTQVHLRRPGTVGQFAAPGQEVGVDVRLQGVGDRQLVLAGQFDVHLHVAAGVDDGGAARRLVADQVGQVRQPLGEHRLENHARRGLGLRLVVGIQVRGGEEQAPQPHRACLRDELST